MLQKSDKQGEVIMPLRIDLCHLRPSSRRCVWTYILFISVLLFVASHFDVLRSNLVQESYKDQEPRNFASVDDAIPTESHPFIPSHPSERIFHQPPNIPRQFLIEEADFCKKRPELKYIVYVHSAISNVQERNDTRSTWANNVTAKKLGVNMAVVYIVGRAKNDEEAQILKYESNTFHDIIQIDLADYYQLLVYKAMAAMAWVTKNCGHIPWTVHTDDDILVDIVLMKQAIEERGLEAKDEFICNVFTSPVHRSGKWGIRSEDWPDTKYPTFCSGPFWILRTRALNLLLDTVKYVKYHWIDDVYLTGYVAKEAGLGMTWLKNYKYHSRSPFHDSHVGNSMIWFPQLGERREHWIKILQYYQNKLNISDLVV